MKKYLVLCVVSVILSGYQSFAQHMHKGHSELSHPMGQLIMQAEKRGITIKGYCNEIKSTMQEMMKNSNIKLDKSKLDPEITHHISFYLSGENVNAIKGVVLMLQQSKTKKTYQLMMMKNHYGSDVSLKKTGTYHGTLVLDTIKKGKLVFAFSFTI